MTQYICHALATLGCGAAGLLLGASTRLSSQLEAECSKQSVSTFTPDEFVPFRLISSRYESHDTRRLYFALNSSDDMFHMPVASCIIAKYTDGTEDVIRPYTPISSNSTRGHFELLVKKYPKGKMGNHLFSLQPGESLLVKGPFEKFVYKPNMWSRVGMIAGGTGITPMYQLIQSILENPKDKTKISLIYANNQRRDILLANELMELQKTYTNFHVYLTLLDVPRRWLGGIGYINKAMLQTFMPLPSERNIKVLISGPPPMLQAVSGDKLFEADRAPQQGPLGGLLRELGYREDQVFKY